MRRLLPLVLAVLICGAAPAGAFVSIGRPAQRLHASPRTGGPHTAFRVRFRAPAASAVGDPQVAYEAAAQMRKGTRRGCLASLSVPVTATRADQRVTAVLRPGPYSSGWCRGRYAGQVLEYLTPLCGPILANPTQRATYACPQFTAMRTLGTFSFRVR